MLGDQIVVELGLYGNDNDFKDYGVDWLFITTLGSLMKRKNKLTALNPCFESLLENQRAFVAALKDSLLFSVFL